MLRMLQHHGAPLSPIASLEREGTDTVAVLRGEIMFAGAEEVLTRLAPFVSDDGCLVLDFSGVTRVGDGSKRVFAAAPELVGPAPDGSARVAVRDPEGVLSLD